MSLTPSTAHHGCHRPQTAHALKPPHLLCAHTVPCPFLDPQSVWDAPPSPPHHHHRVLQVFVHGVPESGKPFLPALPRPRNTPWGPELCPSSEEPAGEGWPPCSTPIPVVHGILEKPPPTLPSHVTGGETEA